MQEREFQAESTEADQAPSFEEVVEAKRVLLRNRCIAQAYPAHYPVHLGLFPIKPARRFLLVVSMLLIVAMGAAAILGVWDVIQALIVGKIVLTCIILFTTVALVVAANFYLGPVKWMTLDEQQEYEAAS